MAYISNAEAEFFAKKARQKQIEDEREAWRRRADAFINARPEMNRADAYQLFNRIEEERADAETAEFRAGQLSRSLGQVECVGSASIAPPLVSAEFRARFESTLEKIKAQQARERAPPPLPSPEPNRPPAPAPEQSAAESWDDVAAELNARAKAGNPAFRIPGAPR